MIGFHRFSLIVLLFSVLPFAKLCFASGKDSLRSPIGVDFCQHAGMIIPNFPDFPKVGPSLLSEINLSWHTRGKQEWHQMYGFPKPGIALMYGWLGNNDVFGQNVSLLPNLQFEWRRERKISFSAKLGMGFSYFTKTYDANINHENRYIGTRITNISIAAFHANWKLSEKLSMATGITSFHFSNGHVQLPNVGINFPTLDVKLAWNPINSKNHFIRDSLNIAESKKILLNVRVGLGVHEFGDPIKPTGGPKYPVYNTSVYLSKRNGQVGNIHLGMHANYYASFYDYIVNQEVYEAKQRLKSSTFVVFLGYEYLIGHFGLVAQLGVFAYNPFFKQLQKFQDVKPSFNSVSKRYITNKLGIQYYFISPMKSTKLKPWVGTAIKANFGQADFAEMSFGVAF